MARMSIQRDLTRVPTTVGEKVWIPGAYHFCVFAVSGSKCVLNMMYWYQASRYERMSTYNAQSLSVDCFGDKSIYNSLEDTPIPTHPGNSALRHEQDSEHQLASGALK